MRVVMLNNVLRLGQRGHQRFGESLAGIVCLLIPVNWVQEGLVFKPASSLPPCDEFLRADMKIRVKM